MDSLFATGIRPLVDKAILEQQQEYPKDYFRVSSAGYCHRYVIMKRLSIPSVPERQDDVRSLRVFQAGHVFHEWMQKVTRDAGISIAQEAELVDEEWGVKGHFDDLVSLSAPIHVERDLFGPVQPADWPPKKLVLYDYKTQNSKAFTWQKGKPMSIFHRMQLGTYLCLLRQDHPGLEEARILKISKDDLRLTEQQLLWSPQLEEEIAQYWLTLKAAWNRYQATGQLPACTCAKIDGGWFGKRNSTGRVWNDFFYNEEPCSLEWMNKTKEEWNK